MPHDVPPAVERLRDALKVNGWTQNAYARLLGLSSGRMSRIMSGDLRMPLEGVVDAAERFGIALEDWLPSERCGAAK